MSLVSTLVTICRTSGPILDSKTAFDRPRHGRSECLAKIYQKVTDDVTDRVKTKIFEYLSSLSSPGKAAVSDCNKADEAARIVSMIPLGTP